MGDTSDAWALGTCDCGKEAIRIGECFHYRCRIARTFSDGRLLLENSQGRVRAFNPEEVYVHGSMRSPE